MIDIIPAIDIIGGKCVRLVQGDFATAKIYNEDPLEVAKAYDAIGIRRLHLVDLDGAKEGRVINIDVLHAIAGNTNLLVDYSGGIKKDDDMDAVFNAGAAYAGIGSMAVLRPQTVLNWVVKYGADKLLLGADIRNNYITVNGWQKETDVHIDTFIEQYRLAGCNNFFCTDVSKDGMLAGTAEELYTDILGRFPGIHLIASGGVSKIEDIDKLEAIGCRGVIIGKAIYEGYIQLEQLKKYL